MKKVEITLETDHITDWDSFHGSCQEVFGFPDFYGRNMDAWIDCVSYLDVDDRMSNLRLSEGDMLNILVKDSKAFRQRVPEIFDSLVDCTEFVEPTLHRPRQSDEDQTDTSIECRSSST